MAQQQYNYSHYSTAPDLWVNGHANSTGIGAVRFASAKEYNAALNYPSNPYKGQWSTTVQPSPEQQQFYDTQTATSNITASAAEDAAKRPSSLIATPLGFLGPDAVPDPTAVRARRSPWMPTTTASKV